MPLFTSSYWEICRYFSNSAIQACSVSGGMAPVTGFHSVMERPEPVRRVAPPMATMRTTRAARMESQARTADRVWVWGRRASGTPWGEAATAMLTLVVMGA
jgi:hypothetical protein